ncbi:MAG: putative glycoside hydrolase [Eubacteriales bacterium]|nr:putative glycoside hydrolase [Eubacteriales bacterium]
MTFSQPMNNKFQRFSLILLSMLLLLSGACKKAQIDSPDFQTRSPEESTVAYDDLQRAVAEDDDLSDETPAEVLSESNRNRLEMLEAYFGALPTVGLKKEYEHFKSKGLYISWGRNMPEAIEICKKTECNTVVLDIKENYGFTYQTKIPLAIEIDAATPGNPVDIKGIVDMFHAEGIRVIGRVVCFNDATLATKRPDLCLKDKNGNTLYWPSEDNRPFTSPYSPVVWDYLIQVCLEAINFGVDEIQLDYVRFPSGSSSSGEEVYIQSPEGYTAEDKPTRAEAINRFIESVRAVCTDRYGIPVGLDCFATVMVFPTDGVAIGQDWASIGLTGADSISPMVYPSHFDDEISNGIGTVIGGQTFSYPDKEPYGIVKASLNAGRTLLTQTSESYFAHIRPFLQSFTAAYKGEGRYIPYGYNEMRAQFQAVYDAGYDEWLLWSPIADYDINWFNSPDNPGTSASQLPLTTPLPKNRQTETLIAEERQAPTGIREVETQDPNEDLETNSDE